MLKPRILMSYEYLSTRKLEILAEMKDDFIFLIDSGAYTAFTRGKIVDMGKYLEMVNTIVDMGFDLTGYFQLDEIGNAEKTKENYITMLDAGYEPMPVFTRGAPVEDLEFFYEHSDIVAIGGIAAGTSAEHSYLKALMNQHIKKRKVHWLGYANANMLFHFKPHQVDVSTHSSGVRFGRIPLFINGIVHTLTRADVSKWLKQPRVRTLITRYGVDPDLFRSNEAWVNRGTYLPETATLGHLVQMSYADYFYTLEKKGITRPYFACSDEKQAMGCIRSYKKILTLKEGK